MKKSRYSEEQIATALRQVEAGAPIPEVTRSLGVSEATYYHWRKKYGQMAVGEIRRLGRLLQVRLDHLQTGDDLEEAAQTVYEAFQVETVDCKLCGLPCAAKVAHLYRNGWIGNSCGCWDERLRAGGA